MAKLKRTSCCGVRDFDGLLEYDSPKEALLEVWRQFGEVDGSFILFTCPTYEKMLTRLVAYIEEMGLGTCVVTPVKMNPNSDNKLRAMLFAPNKNKMYSWYAKTKEDLLMGLYVGARVKSVSRGSERYGRTALVESLEDGGDESSVRVVYQDGSGSGYGAPKDYKLID
mgnify:CR=1 FL=1